MAADDPPDPFSELIELRERLQEVFRPSTRAAVELAARLQRNIKVDLAAVARLQRMHLVTVGLAERMRASWQAALPTNWLELSADEVMPCVDMALESGLSVVWVPRAEIIRALLAADDDAAREVVLIERTGDVLDDLAATLAEATHPQLDDFGKAAMQAIDACRDGHFAAGQSHAAAALSGVVHRKFGEENFSKARARFERDHPDDVQLGLLRMTTLLRVFARALTRTDYALPGFNRHATAHGQADQHTQANALAALLLLVGLLREVHAWFDARGRSGFHNVIGGSKRVIRTASRGRGSASRAYS